MEWSLVKCLWVSLVLLLRIHGSWGCWEEERIALLEIKASVLSWTGGEDGSWVDGKGSDCCAWERVKCDATTGRVIQLSLNDTRGHKTENFPGAYLNVSLFSAFKDLQHLNLSINWFVGWIENEGFERLAGLRKLEVLDLSHNSFNNSILPSLGTLTSLRTLSLAWNYLEGSSHWAELANLHNLQALDLSNNIIEASLQTMQGFERLVGLRKLEVLDLSYNNFNNSILPSLGMLKSLRKLSLPSNHLEGSSHFEELFTLHKLQSLDLSSNSLNASSGKFQGLCQLERLHELDLSRNNFEGILPPCLQNLTVLKSLSLSHNRLTGNIPSSLISSLPSLVYISLGHNDFDGLFPFISFANNSNLEVIDLRSNAGNQLKVEIEYPSWVPPFQLKVLLLSNNNLSTNTSAISRFLSNQHNLRNVDLSGNNLKGMFPTWLLENNKMLDVLMLSNNSLSGHFVLPSTIHEAAKIIDVSNNGFNGLLQENIGKMLPNIEYLDLSKNYFEGHIPPSIADMKMLSVLDLSNNNFSGEIPRQVAIGCNNLLALRVSNNRLHGQILPPYFNWSAHLYSLHLDNNLFSGNMLPGLSKFSELGILDIGNNLITGRVPSWIGNLTNLETFIMRGNFLQGNVPAELCKLESVSFLDLSQNLLVGSIPSILNLTNLQFLHLQGNRFTKTPPTELFNSSSLLTLDIRDNDLYGVIPELIGVLPNLRVLLLKQNRFNGPIPNYFCHLALIDIMDLSHNALSESIPQCLNNISFGRKQDTGPAFVQEYVFGYLFESYYNEALEIADQDDFQDVEEFSESEEVEFIMRSRSNSYKGDILNFVSALDLSCNDFRNEIPSEIGDLNGILALNLSHNQLNGTIPRTLSNLTQIESLDLSFNKLSGEIPSELSLLYSLEVFTVAYNNLSGKTPEMKAQFSTFTSTSYEGNPFLCGPPLPTDCSSNTGSTNTTTIPSIGVKDDDDIDMNAFFASFGASYVVVLLGFAAVLYINPYWRRMWFNFVENCIYSCHDFVSDAWYRFVIRPCT